MTFRHSLPGRIRRPVGSAVAVLAAVLLAACAGEDAPRALHVYAASSLTDAFLEMEQEFERENPGTDVSLTLAGSQILRLQIEQGAPADVFASANLDHVDALVAAGMMTASVVFAWNELTVIVPLRNPAGISSFAELPKAARLVFGTENVPIGRYAREVLHRGAAKLGPGFEAAALSRVVSQENNVRLIRAKVELGEADAAIVYRTDAAASDKVQTISIPDDVNVQGEYSIGLVAGSDNPKTGAAWAAFVLSDEGQAILAGHGFLGPR